MMTPSGFSVTLPTPKARSTPAIAARRSGTSSRSSATSGDLGHAAGARGEARTATGTSSMPRSASSPEILMPRSAAARELTSPNGSPSESPVGEMPVSAAAKQANHVQNARARWIQTPCGACSRCSPVPAAPPRARTQRPRCRPDVRIEAANPPADPPAGAGLTIEPGRLHRQAEGVEHSAPCESRDSTGS